MTWWANTMLFQAYGWLGFAVLDLAVGSPMLAGLDLVIAAAVRLVAYQFARERKVTS